MFAYSEETWDTTTSPLGRVSNDKKPLDQLQFKTVKLIISGNGMCSINVIQLLLIIKVGHL